MPSCTAIPRSGSRSRSPPSPAARRSPCRARTAAPSSPTTCATTPTTPASRRRRASGSSTPSAPTTTSGRVRCRSRSTGRATARPTGLDRRRRTGPLVPLRRPARRPRPVDLTDLANNYDVAVFADIAQAFRRLTSLQDLQQLSAEFAADAFSPSVFSPSVFSPSVFSPSVFSPSVFSPSVFSPSCSARRCSRRRSSARRSSRPSVFSPSVFSPSVFSPTVENDAAAYESAQVRSLDRRLGARRHGARARRGRDLEQHRRVLRPRQRPQRRVHARSRRSTSTCTLDAGNCTGVGADSPAAAVATGAGDGAPDGHPDRPGAACPATAAEKAPAGRGWRRFAARPRSPASSSTSAPMSPRVAALNAQADAQPRCPYAKNLVAEAIKDVVDSLPRAEPARVRVAGRQRRRRSRSSATPTPRCLGPESDYVPPVLDTSASQASLRLQLRASARTPTAPTIECRLKGATLPVPDLAVGRLVETPAEISGVLDAYLGTTAGVVPHADLVARHRLRLPGRCGHRGAQTSSSPASARAPSTTR